VIEITQMRDLDRRLRDTYVDRRLLAQALPMEKTIRLFAETEMHFVRAARAARAQRERSNCVN